MTVIDELIDKIETFNEEQDLKHGNTETYFEEHHDCIFTTIEGYNHTTLTVEFSMDDMKEMEVNNQFYNVLERNYRERINDFDVDETFTELWSETFAKHNGFTARTFIEVLEDDKAHFEAIDYKQKVKWI